ncbi:DUF2813 domain-containing protein, partial [Vibrio parahaemolyticus]|uniref:DUF2813 domain-containing protein n=1 Tax=Vibrio parahaemolyticus TaxID=670 RepID=UPI0021150100
SISHPQSQHIQIIVCLKAPDKHEANDGRYGRIKPAWCTSEDGEHVIYYRISASLVDNDITTKYEFIDRDGKPKQIHHS